MNVLLKGTKFGLTETSFFSKKIFDSHGELLNYEAFLKEETHLIKVK